MTQSPTLTHKEHPLLVVKWKVDNKADRFITQNPLYYRTIIAHGHDVYVPVYVLITRFHN